jgi:hypothetical protein
MRARVLAAAMAAAALTFSGVTGVAGPAAASPVVTSAASEAAYNEAEYEFVLWLANYDERSMVRSTAWVALDPQDIAGGIQRFFATEWASAEELAESGRERNEDFVNYIVDTCVPAYSPEVCAAASAAQRGGTARQAEFVRTGYDAAKARDRRFRDAVGEQAAAIVDTDRAYVAMLLDQHPGSQVQLAARWALRENATDSDLIEFFSHGWAYSAGLDVRAHRTELARIHAQWLRTVDELTITAKEAEKAALGLAGEALAQKRAAAARAWHQVGEATDDARTAWQHAEGAALAQAEVWRQVAAAAAAGSLNWKPILGAADGIGGQWNGESAQARTQAAYWAGLYSDALRAETEWSKPVV